MKKLFTLFIVFQSFAAFAQTYYLEERWLGLRFANPVGMYTAPDNSNRIFILEQNKGIKVFKDSGTVTLADTSGFIDLSQKIQGGSETGVLGMAFHPNFSQNGYVFINYTRKNPLTTVVARYKLMDGNPNKLDPASEKIILTQVQPYTNHNAGSIVFGDDGMLYITLGDGGSGGDPGNRAQNRTVLLGKILRIDINVPIEDSAYQIPPDNPFANNTNNWRKEIYTVGMRNPWKITKDPDGSTIWIADVGQNKYEEVDTLRKGANYGWRITEGDSSYSTCGTCDTSNYEKPIWAYPHSVGYCVTGGFVYRGEDNPKLKGAYVYGDYGSQKMWTLRKNDAGVYTNALLGSSVGSISSFGLDNKKELYVVNYASSGRVYKVRCSPPTPVLTSSVMGVCAGDTIKLTAPTATGVTRYNWSNGDTTRTIKFYNTGTYNISLVTENAFGCKSYQSNMLKLKVNPILLKPLVPNVSGCQGSQNMVSLPGSLIYTWSNNTVGNSISINQPGNYWVYAKDSIGCKSDSAFFSATIDPTPATPSIASTATAICLGDTLSLTTPTVAGVHYQWTTGDTTQNIKLYNTGTYTVSLVVENTFGCKSLPSNILNLLVNPLPLKPVVANVNGCQGSSNMVSFTGSLIYKWSDNSVSNSFSINQTGNYWVFAMDSIGCKSDTAFFSANIQTTPATPVLSVLNGSILKTDSVSGATYIWLKDGLPFQTTAVPSLIPDQFGSFSVILVSEFGCKSDTSQAQTIVVISVNQAVSELLILSPNPFKESVELKWKNVGSNKQMKIEIFDLKGSLVKEIRTQSNGTDFTCQVNLSTLPKGTYTFKIGNGDKTVTRRMVKD